MEKLAKVKGSLSPEEEQKHIDSILQDISALGSKASGINDRIAVISDRVKDALGYKLEMNSIDSSEETFNSNISSYEEGLKEFEPRYKWLENRINSHKEAVIYWEKQPLANDKQEVEA
jgi:predicted  nucleic acid-binding Zn-ribbon protein